MALGSSKPVCYYQFEDNAYDTSDAGNTMDGTLVAPGTFSTVEKMRGSYSFLGTQTGGASGISGCGTTAQIGFMMTGVFTLSWWTKRSTTGGTEYLMGTNTSSPSYAFYIGYANTQITFGRYATSATVANSAINFPAVLDTDWHHVVITCDGSDVKFYSDGTQHGAAVALGSWPGSTTNTCAFMIGSIPDGSSGVDANCNTPWSACYKGYMDELSVWDATATDEEIENLYSNGAPYDLSDGLVYPPPETEVATIGGIAAASIKTIAGISVGSIKNIGGVSPAPSWSPPAWANAYSIEFTSAAHASTDRLDLPNNTDFDFEYTDAFSISLWFKFTAAGWQGLIGKINTWAGGWTSIRGWQIISYAGEIGFWVTSNYQSNGFQAMTTSAFNDGNWHNVVAIKCATCYTAASAEIWVDGVNQSTDYWFVNTTLSNTIVNSGDIIMGGGAFGGYGNGFGGNLDEVGIWSKALSSGEVAAIYNSGAPADLASHAAASNLVSYWRNGDGSAGGTADSTDSSDAAARIYDMSANSHNMTPVNLSSGDKVTVVP